MTVATKKKRHRSFRCEKVEKRNIATLDSLAAVASTCENEVLNVSPSVRTASGPSTASRLAHPLLACPTILADAWKSCKQTFFSFLQYVKDEQNEINCSPQLMRHICLTNKEA